MLSPGGARGVQRLNSTRQVDSENNHRGSLEGRIYYIGLDVHKKTISYCVKDADFLPECHMVPTEIRDRHRGLYSTPVSISKPEIGFFICTIWRTNSCR